MSWTFFAETGFNTIPEQEIRDDTDFLLVVKTTGVPRKITGTNLFDGFEGGGGGNGEAIIGEIRMYGGSSPPSGWLLCDGDEISRAVYSDLFSVIGESFGVGDGSTTFELPDLRGRSPLGVGQGSGLTNRSMGDSDGEEDHQLSEAELAAHTHQVAIGGGTYYQYSGAGLPFAQGGSSSSGSAGSDTVHNTMHPFLAVSFIIYGGV